MTYRLQILNEIGEVTVVNEYKERQDLINYLMGLNPSDEIKEVEAEVVEEVVEEPQEEVKEEVTEEVAEELSPSEEVVEETTEEVTE